MKSYHETVSNFQKNDKGKPRPTLIPASVIWELTSLLEHGAEKYGDLNWMDATKEDQIRMVDAMYRHLLAYLEDTDSIDQDSGHYHITAVLANAMFLTYFNLVEKEYKTYAGAMFDPSKEIVIPGILTKKVKGHGKK